jgi:hypothetical protein
MALTVGGRQVITILTESTNNDPTNVILQNVNPQSDWVPKMEAAFEDYRRMVYQRQRSKAASLRRGDTVELLPKEVPLPTVITYSPEEALYIEKVRSLLSKNSGILKLFQKKVEVKNYRISFSSKAMKSLIYVVGKFLHQAEGQDPYELLSKTMETTELPDGFIDRFFRFTIGDLV